MPTSNLTPKNEKKTKNEEKYIELQEDKINPLFGRWKNPKGIVWLDTCYVDMSESDDDAVGVGSSNEQEAITKLWLEKDENGNEKTMWIVIQVPSSYDRSNIGENDE